ncbi:hypothetical protein PV326_013012, partial [Microctonus aethiopoides]
MNSESNNTIKSILKFFELCRYLREGAKCNNIEDEEFIILQAAREIIRRSIRSQVYCNDYYSDSDKMFTDLDEYIPKPLSYLLSEIILNDKKSKRENISDYENKRKSIAHNIIAAGICYLRAAVRNSEG